MDYHGLAWMSETDTQFQNRCKYAAVKAALDLIGGQGTTANQTVFAKAALAGTLNAAQLAMAVLSNPTIAALSDPRTVTDSDLQFQINAISDDMGAALTA